MQNAAVQLCSQHSEWPQNAPKYAFRDPKIEKFSGEGADLTPIWRLWRLNSSAFGARPDPHLPRYKL